MNPEENQNINNNISPEEVNNFQEKPINTDDDLLNQNMINDNNNIDIDSDNMTNSDINDSKYMPKGTYPQMDNQNELLDNNIDTNIDINNFIPKSPNQMNLQSQIMNIENDNMLLEQNIEQLEYEHNQLQSQLMEFQDLIINLNYYLMLLINVLLNMKKEMNYYKKI